MRLAGHIVKILRHRSLMSLLIGAMICVPSFSFAAGGGQIQNVDLNKQQWGISLSSCSGKPATDVVSSVVDCVQQTVRNASQKIAAVISTWMTRITIGLFTLSVVILGMQIAGGVQGMGRNAIIHVIKMGFIVGYSAFIPDVLGLAFNITDKLALLAGGGQTPWATMTDLAQKFMGFGLNTNIDKGLLYIIGAAFFSGVLGIPVFVTGIMAALSLLSFITRAIFTYVASIVIIGFMVGIMGIFLPWIVFRVSERYFRQWLSITIGAMLQPMAIFAICGLTLAMLPKALDDVWEVQPNKNWRGIIVEGVPQSTWMAPTDRTLALRLKGKWTNNTFLATRTPPQLNTFLFESMDISKNNVPELNFGLIQLQQMQKLFEKFLLFMLLCMLVRQAMDLLPEIFEAIAGVQLGLAQMAMPYQESVSNLVNNKNTEGGK